MDRGEREPEALRHLDDGYPAQHFARITALIP